MATGRNRSVGVLALIFGAGVASAFTALATYFTRYSKFDSLMGEIDSSFYAQITQMAAAEKAALILGAALIAISIVGLLVRRRRPTLEV